MNLLYIRDLLWDYPYYIFVGKTSYLGKFISFYRSTRPLSYIITTIIVSLVVSTLLLTQFQSVLGFNRDTFVEGVIVGVNPSGEPIGPTRLNPLQRANPQLDKDILELIYEPLIKIDQSGNIEPILAEKFTPEESEGEDSESDEFAKSYRFSLKKNVKWHDGKEFTTKDVKATFDLIKELGDNIPNAYSSTGSKNIQLEILDDYVCRFTINNEIIPNFYELINFKILPAHLIAQFRDAILTGQFTGNEQLISVGTGPFSLLEVQTDRVILEANHDYHNGSPQLNRFVFRLLRDENEAEKAIRSGEIHGITNISTKLVESVSDMSNFEVRNSNVIYTQYWGIYFNLGDSGPKSLKEKIVRKAFSNGINREVAVNSIYKQAKVATGPIASNSPFYVKKYQQPQYNKDQAIKLLKEDGWKLKDKAIDDEKKKIWTKDNQELNFEIAYVDDFDREQIINQIRLDLAAIGINLVPKPMSPENLRNARLKRNFDTILFGVSTFVDPDRYEFFHSEQTSENGGLNIGAYKSEKTIADIDDEKRKTIRVPIVDKLLDDARKTTDLKERKEDYKEFQQVLADEVPVIFLYHPTIQYLLNNRVQNLKLENMKHYEDRFYNIENWIIEY
jgi:peptide/nickel transport system substrate-binding protein